MGLVSTNIAFATLDDANLTVANLTTANRSRTNLICASLTGAIFSGGNRFGAIWHYATCSNGTVISTSC